MNFVWRLILTLLGHHAKLRLLSEAKKVGILAYLRALQGTRYVLISVLAGFLILQFMVLAAFGALVTGFMLWNEEFEFKLQILFGLFAGMFALPSLLLLILFSERFWYKFSGAKKLVEDIHAEKTKHRDAA